MQLLNLKLIKNEEAPCSYKSEPIDKKAEIWLEKIESSKKKGRLLQIDGTKWLNLSKTRKMSIFLGKTYSPKYCLSQISYFSFGREQKY